MYLYLPPPLAGSFSMYSSSPPFSGQFPSLALVLTTLQWAVLLTCFCHPPPFSGKIPSSLSLPCCSRANTPKRRLVDARVSQPTLQWEVLSMILVHSCRSYSGSKHLLSSSPTLDMVLSSPPEFFLCCYPYPRPPLGKTGLFVSIAFRGASPISCAPSPPLVH